MSKVAGKIPGTAKLPSATRRMSRLLDNPAIRVREWYEPIARHWLEEQLRRIGEIRLTVDGTKIGFGHQLLIVAIAYRKRAIPIAWTWVKSSRGHSSSHKGVEYALMTLTSEGRTFEVVSDDQGRAWLIAGTDSGFEGPTKVYYNRIVVHMEESVQ